MYYQVEQVLEQQEPEIEKFYKGRGLLICEAKQGLFALKEYFGSAQKAEFLYWLGICLEQQGILCDSMLKNKDGNLITEGPDRIPYTFHRWVRGRECEVKNRTELLETVSFLADFHRCCSESGVEQTEEESAEEEMTKLGEEYVRHNRELKHIRKYILKRNNRVNLSVCIWNAMKHLRGSLRRWWNFCSDIRNRMAAIPLVSATEM